MEKQLDYDVLAEKVADRLDAKRSLDKATHNSHHQYIEAQLQKEKDRAELRKALKKNVFTWATIGVLIGLWQLFVYWFESVTNGGPHG